MTVFTKAAGDPDLPEGVGGRAWEPDCIIRGVHLGEYLISGLTPSKANQKPQPKHTALAHPIDEPLQSMMEGHAGSLAGCLRPFLDF